jgi:hypothetical protein
MVTATVPRSPGKTATGAPGRRFDDVFFSAMAVLMLVTVFVGFAHTYYLAGIFRAPLPSLIIHVHGAAFSCWMLLLLTQTTLVSAGRVDISSPPRHCRFPTRVCHGCCGCFGGQ